MCLKHIDLAIQEDKTSFLALVMTVIPEYPVCRVPRSFFSGEPENTGYSTVVSALSLSKKRKTLE